MSDGPILPIETLVPGGILESDHVHVGTNDETCSRCRRAVPEHEVPILLWLTPDDLLIYCNVCTQTPDDRGDARALVADLEPDDPDACTNPDGHEFEHTGTAYGGDDPRWHGEGRCYCIHCGADGDA